MRTDFLSPDSSKYWDGKLWQPLLPTMRLDLLSADREKWWDGQNWRPLAPGSQFTPDGKWLWTGDEWIPMTESLSTEGFHHHGIERFLPQLPSAEELRRPGPDPNDPEFQRGLEAMGQWKNLPPPQRTDAPPRLGSPEYQKYLDEWEEKRDRLAADRLRALGRYDLISVNDKSWRNPETREWEPISHSLDHSVPSVDQLSTAEQGLVAMARQETEGRNRRAADRLRALGRPDLISADGRLWWNSDRWEAIGLSLNKPVPPADQTSTEPFRGQKTPLPKDISPVLRKYLQENEVDPELREVFIKADPEAQRMVEQFRRASPLLKAAYDLAFGRFVRSTTSKDGEWWWDGSRWIPASNVEFEQFQEAFEKSEWANYIERLSPDGSRWWDGSQWVPIRQKRILWPLKLFGFLLGSGSATLGYGLSGGHQPIITITLAVVGGLVGWIVASRLARR